MPEISRILSALDRFPDESGALATLVRVEGSSYRRPGARLLILKNGGRVGSISGGCLEDDVVARAQRVIAGNQVETAVYDTTSENDLVWGVGLGCQGVVHIFIEPLPRARPHWVTVLGENLRACRNTALTVVHGGERALGTGITREMPDGVSPDHVFQEVISAPSSLVIFGGGDDVRPLVRMAKELGWRVTVADSRPAYAAVSRFPEADAVVLVGPADAVVNLVADHTTFVVIMSHRYVDDLHFLRQLLPLPLAYLGLLGPRKRTDRLLAELRRDGFVPDQSMLARLHAPVGLDLGGNTPETVALSTLAEIQGCLSRRSPIHLRDRTAPIHG